jgi:hypothetical protein
MNNSMKESVKVLFLLVFFALSVHGNALAAIVFETKSTKIEIGVNAEWRSIVDKASGRELCYQGAGVPFAEIIIDDGAIPAASVKSLNAFLVLFKFLSRSIA